MKQFVEDLQKIIDKIFERKINNDDVSNKMSYKRIIVLLEEAKQLALSNRYFCLNTPVNLYAISSDGKFDELYSDLVHIKVKSIYYFSDLIKDFVNSDEFEDVSSRKKQYFLNNLEYYPEMREELINVILAGGIEKYDEDLINVDEYNIKILLDRFNLIDSYTVMFDLKNDSRRSSILEILNN